MAILLLNDSHEINKIQNCLNFHFFLEIFAMFFERMKKS